MTPREGRALLKVVSIGWLIFWIYMIVVNLRRSPANRMPGVSRIIEGDPQGPIFLILPLIILLFLALTEPPRPSVEYNDSEPSGSRSHVGAGAGLVKWIGEILVAVISGLILAYLTFHRI